LVLPNAAIKRQGSQMGAWVMGADGLRFSPLRLGQSSLDGQVQVLDGLQAGEQVVVYSEKDVGAKSRIEVVSSLPGAGPKPTQAQATP
jgi:HlyD family secretion protein